MEYTQSYILNIPKHFSNFVHSYINPNTTSNNNQFPVVKLIVVGVSILKLSTINQNQLPKLSLVNFLENQLVCAFHSPKPVI